MIKFSSFALATALILTGVSAAEARSWQRTAGATGPYGGHWSSSGSGSCAGGSCSSNQSWTGPGGNTVTRSGTTTCSGGSCQGSATYTGPSGNTVTRTRSFSGY
jgi:hypothetical protein